MKQIDCSKHSYIFVNADVLEINYIVNVKIVEQWPLGDEVWIGLLQSSSTASKGLWKPLDVGSSGKPWGFLYLAVDFYRLISWLW